MFGERPPPWPAYARLAPAKLSPPRVPRRVGPTDLAARYTEDRRGNFDIYLPVWLARQNKTIFGTLFLAGGLVHPVGTGHPKAVLCSFRPNLINSLSGRRNISCISLRNRNSTGHFARSAPPAAETLLDFPRLPLRAFDAAQNTCASP